MRGGGHLHRRFEKDLDNRQEMQAPVAVADPFRHDSVEWRHRRRPLREAGPILYADIERLWYVAMVPPPLRFILLLAFGSAKQSSLAATSTREKVRESQNTGDHNRKAEGESKALTRARLNMVGTTHFQYRLGLAESWGRHCSYRQCRFSIRI
jgi:hypothetical protein